MGFPNKETPVQAYPAGFTKTKQLYPALAGNQVQPNRKAGYLCFSDLVVQSILSLLVKCDRRRRISIRRLRSELSPEAPMKRDDRPFLISR
jgi:hypothetical protein